MSTGGVEPPQLSPHAPQACVSTIPPHRHKWFVLFRRCWRSACGGGLSPPLDQQFTGLLVSAEYQHRHKLWYLFDDVDWLLVVEVLRTLSKNVTFSHLFLGRVPHRHKWFKLFLDVEGLLVVEDFAPSRKTWHLVLFFLVARVKRDYRQSSSLWPFALCSQPARQSTNIDKMICVYLSISISFCKYLSSITQKYNLQFFKYLKGKFLWLLILLVRKVCKVEI